MEQPPGADGQRLLFSARVPRKQGWRARDHSSPWTSAAAATVATIDRRLNIGKEFHSGSHPLLPHIPSEYRGLDWYCELRHMRVYSDMKKNGGVHLKEAGVAGSK